MSEENIINIGEAELEVMKVIWRSKGAISTSEIGKALESHGWKRTTISTFLSRLVDKGAIAAEKSGKTVFYTPLLTSKQYKKAQIKNLVGNVFDGSAKDLVASLFEESTFSVEDIAELKAIFDNKE